MDVEARIAQLEAALAAERQARAEALLWQEHRVLAAVRNLIQHRADPALRAAALGGLVSAVLGRAPVGAMVLGGTVLTIAGALLALQANYLLSLQNERMDVQTVVMEQQRRSAAFQAEFASILTQLDAERARAGASAGAGPQPTVRRAAADASRDARPADEAAAFLDPQRQMAKYGESFAQSPTLSARIATLSRIQDPMPFMQLQDARSHLMDQGALGRFAGSMFPRQAPVPVLEAQFRSPERGQLLLTLLALRSDLEAIHRAGADFSQADLIERSVVRARFAGAQLRGAWFSRGDIDTVTTRSPDVSGRADLRGANFQDARLNGADLSNADLADAVFVGAHFGATRPDQAPHHSYVALDHLLLADFRCARTFALLVRPWFSGDDGRSRVPHEEAPDGSPLPALLRGAVVRYRNDWRRPVEDWDGWRIRHEVSNDAPAIALIAPAVPPRHGVDCGPGPLGAG